MRRPPLLLTLCAAIILVALGLAATSPLLAYRDAVYIVAGLAGVLAFAVLLLQPLLAGGYLAGVVRGRRVHRILGALLVALVILHVAALWVTSPPDVVDALLLRSPTPFSVWGVMAMWAVFATAGLALMRRRMRLQHWRLGHTGLAVLIVGGTVAHAALIEGTMEPVSKVFLSVAVLLAAGKALWDVWAKRR